MTTELENTEYDNFDIIIEESSDDEETQIIKDLTIYNDSKNEYYIGSEVCELLGHKNITHFIKMNVSDDNKITFKNYTGNKEPVLDPRQILITKEGVYELLQKNIKKMSQHVIDILIKANIDVSKIIKDDEDTDEEKNDEDELTMYSYINNGYCFEYFVGLQITSLIGYSNVTQALSNVSKQNKLEFRDYPGVKKPKLDPKSILITRDGAIELLIKTRKRISQDILHLFKEFGIDTTNRKCLTKEQQTLSAIANTFKTEKIEDQFKVGKYYLDMYFPEYKIVVECDENGHADRKPYKERERMDYVNKEFDINDTHWMRYNPDEHDFDLSKVIGRIYNRIILAKKDYMDKELREFKEKFDDEIRVDKEEKWMKLEIIDKGKFAAPPKDYLIEKLKKYNISDIAQYYGISTNPVSKWLKQYDLNIKDFHNYDPPSKEDLVKVSTNKSQTEIANHYNVTCHIVRKWLKKYDLNIYDLKLSQKQVTKNELIKLIDETSSKEELAEKLNVSEKTVDKIIKSHNIDKMPSKEELEKNLHLKSKDELAEFYNTCRTTLRKWIKSYGLEDIRFTKTTHRPIIVIQNNIQIRYESMVELEKELNISHSKVGKCIKNKEEYRGFEFRYADEKEDNEDEFEDSISIES